ncbi:MAG TPA: RES family NAD+ phosphorylase, partial [Geothrix sp.]
MKPPVRAGIHWDPAFRIVATRFPAVDLWDGLDPALWDRLDQVEALTNPRLTAEASEASSYIQWPFVNPHPGRFSTASLGAFYAAREERGAVAETVHHQAIRCREDRLDPHEFDMRVLSVEVEGR